MRRILVAFTAALLLAAPATLHADESPHPAGKPKREPDQWQPEWIRRKYFNAP